MSASDAKTRARLEFLEWEARHRPRVHALRLLALALLGYLYPAALVLFSFALLAGLLALGPAAWRGLDDFRVVILYVAAVVAALVLTVAVMSSFLVSLPEADGHPLGLAEAAPLGAMVEEARAAVGAPPVHRVHVDARLNAAAAQRPRFGFWGPSKNYLFVGVPLLAALTPAQLRSVLAHELGHLRGRHNGFTAWVYRVQQTWASLAAPFRNAPWLRRAVMGWFVARYGDYFSASTLALRRLHEYEADRRAAGAAGAADTAAALARLAWADYRMSHELWPALFRESGREPLPPADVLGRIGGLFASPPPGRALARWRRRERDARTPVSAEHPRLAERLAALGCPGLLDAAGDGEVVPGVPAEVAPDASALALLGESRARLTAVANASWKAMAIGRWRAEHAAARAMRDAAAKAIRDAGQAVGEPGAGESGAGESGAGERGASEPAARPGDESGAESGEQSGSESVEGAAAAAWERVRVEAEYRPPGEAAVLLRDFLARFPGHGAAHFSLGRLLLECDEDGFAEELEAAMAADSDFAGPGLQLLFEHHRAAGRDAEADALRARLERHAQALAAARTERTSVSRRDRFLPHDLKPQEVEKLRRLLNRYPRVRAAYLARKQVRHFSDKPGYVLAVRRRSQLLGDNRQADKHLVESLRAEVAQPCAVVLLGATSRGLVRRMMRVCPSPLFEAND
jgi:Zn-dependent protease with chaperone function